MLEELLPSHCYICQELCTEKSPCECEAYVHTACLEEFNSISEKTVCTICKVRLGGADTVDVPSRPSLPPQIGVLLLFLVYFLMGVVGQIILYYPKNPKNPIQTFWTLTFFLCSAITSACVLLPTYIAIKCFKK